MFTTYIKGLNDMVFSTSENPEEQLPSPGVLGRIGSWFSPWRGKSAKSPTENAPPTGDPVLKPEGEQESGGSVRAEAGGRLCDQKEKASEPNPLGLPRDVFFCEEADAAQSARRDRCVVGRREPAEGGPKEEEFLEGKKRDERRGQGKEGSNGNSVTGNPEKNVSHLTHPSSAAEQGVAGNSDQDLTRPPAHEQEHTQTGRRFHVYVEEISVTQSGQSTSPEQEVVRTKVKENLQVLPKSKSSPRSGSAADKSQNVRASAPAGVKPRKDCQPEPPPEKTARDAGSMGRKNVAKRRSRKNSLGEGGSSPQEKVPANGRPAAGHHTSDESKPLMGEAAVSSSHEPNPTCPASPGGGESATSCPEAGERSDKVQDAAPSLARAVAGGADMEGDDGLYKVERKTETPESKRRSMKVSQSEVKLFKKCVPLKGEQSPAAGGGLGVETPPGEKSTNGAEEEAADSRVHVVKNPEEQPKPAPGRIADKISLFERQVAGGRQKTPQSPRSADVSPARKVGGRLRADLVSDLRSRSAERYGAARSGSASPNREIPKTIKERMKNFTQESRTGPRAALPPTSVPKSTGAEESVASKSPELDSQGELDRRKQTETTAVPEITLKPDGRDTSAAGVNASASKEKSTDSETDKAAGRASTPRQERDPDATGTGGSKGPRGTGSRSKRRRSREPVSPQSPRSPSSPNSFTSKDEGAAEGFTRSPPSDAGEGTTADKLSDAKPLEPNTEPGSLKSPEQQVDSFSGHKRVQAPEPPPPPAAARGETQTTVDPVPDVLPQKEENTSVPVTGEVKDDTKDDKGTLLSRRAPTPPLEHPGSPAGSPAGAPRRSDSKSEAAASEKDAGRRRKETNDTSETTRQAERSRQTGREETQTVRDAQRQPEAASDSAGIRNGPTALSERAVGGAGGHVGSSQVRTSANTEQTTSADPPQTRYVSVGNAVDGPVSNSHARGRSGAELLCSKPRDEAAPASSETRRNLPDDRPPTVPEASAPAAVDDKLSPSAERISGNVTKPSPGSARSQESNVSSQIPPDASTSTPEKVLRSDEKTPDRSPAAVVDTHRPAADNQPNSTLKTSSSSSSSSSSSTAPKASQPSPDSIKKLSLPRRRSRDDSEMRQDAPSSWLDVDVPKQKLRFSGPKLTCCSSESDLLDTSGEIDDNDFIEKINNLCAPFSLPPRKHNVLRPPQPPFAMPAIREVRLEKTFDPEEFQFGLRKKNHFTLDSTPSFLGKLQHTDTKSGLKPARASFTERSVLLGNRDTRVKERSAGADEGDVREEKDDVIKVKSRLEGSCVLSSLTSSSIRGKRNGHQAQAEGGGGPGDVSPGEPPLPSPPPAQTSPVRDTPSPGEAVEHVVSESGPPLPSFNDIKLPDYLEKYLPPREAAKSAQSAQETTKTEVKKPSPVPVVDADLRPADAVPPFSPGVPPYPPALPELTPPLARPEVTRSFTVIALSSRERVTPAGVNNDDGKVAGETKIPEGELLLQALNGFVLVITASGTIFYSSHTIQDYLGFHQTDVMHQSVYELVHTEDQQELRRNLHWALNPPPAASSSISQDLPADMEPDSSSSLVTYNPEQLPPENSSFLERSFVCRFRCLLDNSSGFLALNFQGRLKFLHGQNQRQENGGKAPPQLALFAVVTPLQPPSILEIRTKNMIFRTKHKLDFTPLACDAKGKIVLGYTEAELRVRGSGYQFIHAADMLYCAENHVRMMKTGESGLTVFRLLTKENRWKWVQANARLVYKNGKPDYIIATQRPLLDEEGGEHLRKRSMHLPFTYATGEALLYQSNHPIAGFRDGSHEKNGSKSKKSRTERLVKEGLDPGSLLGALMSQDESVYVCQPAMEPKMSFHSSFFDDQMGFSDSKPSSLHRNWDTQTNGVVDQSIPEPGTSFDPLLATLDSLSLESQGVVDSDDGGCSNGELFGALEGLGLSAEDLELLLLDERMIRVEIDPERVPTLDDLLTNDEILSYIYDSIEGKADSTEHGGQQAPPSSTSVKTTSVSVPDSKINSDTSVQLQFPPHKPPLVGNTPIIQLSQQMQKHLNMHPGKAAQDWGQQGEHLDHGLVNGELLRHAQSTSNGQWTAEDILLNAGIQLEHISSHQQTMFNGKTSELEPQPTHPSFLQPQQQQQQQQPLMAGPLAQTCPSKAKAAGLNGLCGIPSTEHAAVKSQWQDYGFGDGLGPCLDHSQKPLTNTSLDPCMDFSMPGMDNAEFTLGGSALFGSNVQQLRAEATVSSFQNHKRQPEQIPVPLAQVISSLSQCPPPNASLEHILGVGKPCRQLDPYSMVTSEIPHDPNHSKMENGCILTATYPGGCAVPNGNGAAPPAVQMPCPETLSGLPDPPATGFYL